MAHFAQIDENNVVLTVIVVSNDDILDENGQENEDIGIAFCKQLLGEHTNWVQTSYNNNFRGRYAVIGGIYNYIKNIFVPPKPNESNLDFVYDETANDWVLSYNDPQFNEILEKL